MEKYLKESLKASNGITLIALVITIIVLLILAGISISMLSGDNSILQRATESKEKTETGQEKESITLAYNSVIIDKTSKENNAVTADEFDKAIKTYDSKATTKSEGSKIIVTFSNGHKYTVYKNGTVGEYVDPPLAKNTLTVTVNEDESVESPYFVNYPSAKGTIKCRVLYNDSTYGLQLISVNPVTTVELGKNDPNENVKGEMGSIERAQSSYNRAITTLNEKAEEYIATSDGSILATDARCVGSNPLDKNFPDNLTGNEKNAQMFTADSSYTYMSDYSGKYFKTNSHYTTDYDRLDEIGALEFTDKTKGNYCWLASRYVNKPNTIQKFHGFALMCFMYNSVFNTTVIWRVNTDETLQGFVPTRGLRPIFTLSSGVKVIDGEGTEEVPFEIGL